MDGASEFVVRGFTNGYGAVEIEMVADGPKTGDLTLALKLLSHGLVQTLLGQITKDSSNEGVEPLKPLARNSVYTLAD
jgi:hypothetical protein